MRSVRIVASLVLVLAAALSFHGIEAQESLVRDQPGSWKPALPIMPKTFENVPVADRAAATELLNQLLKMLHRMPSLAQPRGYDIIPHARSEFEGLDGQSDDKREKHVAGTVQVNLASFEKAPKGVVSNEHDSAASNTISMNDMSFLRGSELGNREGRFADDEGMFISSPPESTGTAHGYPVFELNQDHWVVLTRNKVPFFAPVSRERFLAYKIADAQERLDTATKKRSKERTRSLHHARNQADHERGIGPPPAIHSRLKTGIGQDVARATPCTGVDRNGGRDRPSKICRSWRLGRPGNPLRQSCPDGFLAAAVGSPDHHCGHHDG